MRRSQMRGAAEADMARMAGQNEALVGRVRLLTGQVAAFEATIAECVLARAPRDALPACHAAHLADPLCAAASNRRSTKRGATNATAEALATAEEARSKLLEATTELRSVRSELSRTQSQLQAAEARAADALGRAQMAERHVKSLGAAVEDGAAAEQVAASELAAADALVAEVRPATAAVARHR